MAKAVVFDMGGVMLRLNRERCIENYHSLAGFMNIEEHLDIFQQKGFIGELECGDITEDEFYEKALSHCFPGTTRETVKYCFLSLLDGCNQEIIDLIKELHSMGVDLYILSNNNPISERFLEEILAKEGIIIWETFKKGFFSFQMKMIKPEPYIYKQMISEIGRDPQDLIFIDDSQANIAAARDQGITTVLYEPGSGVRSKVLEKL